MHDLKWSNGEKNISRRVFESALAAELAETLAEFKAKAAAAGDADAMWDIRTWLATRQRDIDTKYDYRYSQLIYVFGQLLRESRIREEQLAGLSEDKLALIRRIVNL